MKTHKLKCYEHQVFGFDVGRRNLEKIYAHSEKEAQRLATDATKLYERQRKDKIYRHCLYFNDGESEKEPELTSSPS